MNSNIEKVFSVVRKGTEKISGGAEDTEETISWIERNPAIQGGAWCLKGTRIPIYSIQEALDQGASLKEIIKGMKEWSVVKRISKEILEQAIEEYKNKKQVGIPGQ